MSIESFEHLPGWENSLPSSFHFPEQQGKEYGGAGLNAYGVVEEGDTDGCEEEEGARRRYQSEAHYIQGHDSSYRWWIPKQGIDEIIIRAHVQPYLGPDAVVAPGPDLHGTPGYFISAYRTFTPAMIQDMQSDSAEYLALLSKNYTSAHPSAMEDVRTESVVHGYSDGGEEGGGGEDSQHETEEDEDEDEDEDSEEDNDEMTNEGHS